MTDKYYCSKCKRGKNIKDVLPKINTTEVFVNIDKPGTPFFKVPIICKECGSEVLELVNK